MTTRKTDIFSANPSEKTKHVCIIHRGSKHTINECRAFQSKSLENRTLLRNHNICLRCCETSDHFANKCQTKTCCDICKSNLHCTALHPLDDPQTLRRQFSNTASLIQKHGEESLGKNQLAVNSNCTEICGKLNFPGRSCARIIQVRIYPEGQPENSIAAYSMLDDQSNKTLGRSILFDSFKISSTPIEYSMQSCSGKSHSYGRIASGLVVEEVNSPQKVILKLPPVLECDNIPEKHTEIPTLEVARCYPHMKDIAKHLHALDSYIEILLLIGRDLLEAHHTIDQGIGPLNAPFAQCSPLGWIIIGNVCLSGQHVTPSPVNSNKTFISQNGKPTSFDPCNRTVNILNTGNFVDSCRTRVPKMNIFETTSDDNKSGLSIEDRKFLDIMDNEFHLNSEKKWTAPLPFRSPREPMPDNYKMAKS